MSAKVELIGGAFQDSKGNVLANGYLKFVLSQDCSVTGVGNIASGIAITVTLDASGNANTGQFLWGNDVLLPQPNYYRVTGFTSAGQPAWGPNNQQVTGSGTFDLGTWIPNTVISWTPSISQPLVLKHNGTVNASQTILNLESTDASVIITDLGGGNIDLQAGGSGVPSGTNVWPAGFSGWLSNLFTQGVFGGSTCANMLPGRLAFCFPASWKVTFSSFGGNTTKIAACSIAICDTDSPVVNSTHTVTFSSSPTATYTTTVTSDAIPIQIDAEHDYYLLVYYDPTSGDPGYWQASGSTENLGAIYSSVNNTTPANILTTNVPTTDVNVFYKKIQSA